jgi:hypothetical protein
MIEPGQGSTTFEFPAGHPERHVPDPGRRSTEAILGGESLSEGLRERIASNIRVA